MARFESPHPPSHEFQSSNSRSSNRTDRRSNPRDLLAAFRSDVKSARHSGRSSQSFAVSIRFPCMRNKAFAEAPITRRSRPLPFESRRQRFTWNAMLSDRHRSAPTLNSSIVFQNSRYSSATSLSSRCNSRKEDSRTYVRHAHAASNAPISRQTRPFRGRHAHLGLSRTVTRSSGSPRIERGESSADR